MLKVSAAIEPVPTLQSWQSDSRDVVPVRRFGCAVNRSIDQSSEKAEKARVVVGARIHLSLSMFNCLFLYLLFGINLPSASGEPPTLCRRVNKTSCRGSITKFVEADSSWVIPPLQETSLGAGIMLSGFGDINDDGSIDMVSVVNMNAGSEDTVHLILYENTAGNESGTSPIWVKKETLATDLAYPRSLAASLSLVDLNHDDKLDIVLSDFSIPVIFYNNTGEINRAEWIKVDKTTTESPFAEMIEITKDQSIAVFGDMDGDGDLDAILGRHSDGVYYIENIPVDNKPVYKQSGGIIMAGSPTSIVLVDLDHDGDLDLLIGGFAVVHVLENTGSHIEPAWTKRDEAWMSFDTRGFASSQSASTPDFCSRVKVQQMIDIDLDGMLDFVYATLYKMKFFRSTKGSGANHFIQRTEWDLVDEDVGMRGTPVGFDLNQDGHCDLVAANADGDIEYYLFEKIGTNGVEYSESKKLKDKEGNDIKIAWGRPAVMDVDLDGVTDLLFGSYVPHGSVGEGVQLYKNTAVSSLNPFTYEKQSSWPLSSACTSGWCWAATGHFNDDNILDLMINNKMFKHNSDGTFTDQTDEWGNGLNHLTNDRKFRDNGLGKFQFSQITFGDVDLDGDDDAIIGTNEGTLEYYERTELSPPKWIKQDASDEWSLANVNVGGYAKPTLMDYDNDGDLDLIVGNGAGNFFLFEQGTCASSCTTSGSCNIGTQYMPTCSCAFQGATDGKSCNSW